MPYRACFSCRGKTGNQTYSTCPISRKPSRNSLKGVSDHRVGWEGGLHMSTTCPISPKPLRNWLKGGSDPGGGGGGRGRGCLHMSTTFPSLRKPSRNWLKGVSDPIISPDSWSPRDLCSSVGHCSSFLKP